MIWSVIVGVLLILATKWLFTSREPTRPLPPGPPGKPIVGNISDLPAPGTQDWLHWMKHKELYGRQSAMRRREMAKDKLCTDGLKHIKQGLLVPSQSWARP